MLSLLNSCYLSCVYRIVTVEFREEACDGTIVDIGIIIGFLPPDS